MSNNQSNRNRQQRPSIRGPRSALTDFLASQNISAARIRNDAQARLAQAAADASSNAPATSTNQDAGEESEDQVVTAAARRAQTQKRKKQQAAIDKIKESKTFKKRKHAKGDDDDDNEDDDELAWRLLEEKSTPLPGQMSNCDICSKRFTVTPYSRAGPNGGLLCSPCGRKQTQDEDDVKKKKQKRGPAPKKSVSRRKLQSNLLDGQVGAKDLLTLCIETLAKNIDHADDLGGIPPHTVDRVARMLCKRRLVDSRTVQLFLDPYNDAVKLYDVARLSSDDLVKIFQIMTQLKTLKLYNAIQFKDKVMRYLITRNIELEHLHISGANLLSEEVWTEYLTAKGKSLKSLQISYTDKHIGDDFLGKLPKLAPSLEYLKICHNQQITDAGVSHIGELSQLKKLSLELNNLTTTEVYVNLIKKLGKQLRSLSLKRVSDVDDRLLDALHEHCTSLTKLRITGSEFMTDAGFARLFKDWGNNGLSFIDLEKNRYLDSSKPRDNAHMVGLCSAGFEALMEHSRLHIRNLSVHACRHISRETFERVFATDKTYPEIRDLEISFCEEVTDYVVGCIFRSCPNLRELNVFGCMKVKDVRVPRGRILVGVPNAVGMRAEGIEDE
ncbi:RNI-like protein [Xylariaceae sp. FL1019]|nr:RNI-like protein [Xylariaceae sp. FL1019]